MDKQEDLYTAGWNVQMLWKTVQQCHKKLNREGASASVP